VIRYLYEVHGFEGIQPWFSQDLNEIEKDIETFTRRYRSVPEVIVVDLLGVPYLDQWDMYEIEYIKMDMEGMFFIDRDFSDAEDGVIDVFGYRYLIKPYRWDGFVIDGQKYSFDISDDQLGFVLYSEKDIILFHSLQEFIGNITEADGFKSKTKEDLFIKFENDFVQGVLSIEHMRGQQDKQGMYIIEELTGTVLLLFKE
jgi:hypothetical protein